MELARMDVLSAEVLPVLPGLTLLVLACILIREFYLSPFYSLLNVILTLLILLGMAIEGVPGALFYATG